MSCDNSFGMVTLTLADSELTQVFGSGSAFKFPVKPDGSIYDTYRNSSGEQADRMPSTRPVA